MTDPYGKFPIMGMAEVAEYTGIAPATLAKLAYRGQMPFPDGRINAGRTKYWFCDTIDEWLRTRNHHHG